MLFERFKILLELKYVPIHFENESNFQISFLDRAKHSDFQREH